MTAYYNEIDPHAAQWIRNLITAGLVPAGDVDERSIEAVRGDDLRGYTQCHFFAGIAGWAYALRLVGWPDEHAVWTGSCPCQPFSAANKLARGEADRRHLFPELHRLARECSPTILFGEQVASQDGLEWFSRVRFDLEASGYAVGAANLPACIVGSPQKRERLWFVAVGVTEGIRRGEGIKPFPCPQGGWTHCRQSPWSDESTLGRDGRRRRHLPGTPVVAHGIPARIPKVRAFGNAINPHVAAEFIAAAALAYAG